MFYCNQNCFGEECHFKSDDLNQVLFHKMASQNMNGVSHTPSDNDQEFFLRNSNIV